MSNKPDNVVYNEEFNTYDAFLKPYATSFTAPVIKKVDTISWKKENIHQANSQFKSTFEEIKKQYQALLEEYQYNDIIYAAKFNFKPIVGEVYHLYKRGNDDFFLSILSPKECSFNYIGSYRLSSDKVWKKIEEI